MTLPSVVVVQAHLSSMSFWRMVDYSSCLKKKLVTSITFRNKIENGESDNTSLKGSHLLETQRRSYIKYQHNQLKIIVDMNTL